MAKSNELRQKKNSRGHRSSLNNKLSSQCKKVCRDAHNEKLQVEASKKKEWENALCSVCMEFPHNAVLLLCSSYEKGCRPYMCATSHRYSNCLEQYRKAYTKPCQTTQLRPESMDNKVFSDESRFGPELLCPLCRGPVKGWTVVEPARNYLDAKKRTCTQDDCSFVGTYKEIKKHVKLNHPLARPRDVDPTHVEKWKKLENERDFSDVMSTIRSTMPGSIVIGDYVIERNGDASDDMFFRLPPYGGRWNGPTFSRGGFVADYDSVDDGYFRVRAPFGSRSARRGVSRISRLHARLLFGRQMGRLGR